MKAIFLPENQNKIEEVLKQLAQKYKAELKKDDDGDGGFILADPKLKIVQKSRDNKNFIYIWGATQEDISYFEELWGKPLRTTEEKLTPLEFATELVSLPNKEDLTKEEIKEVMELNERDYNQYKRVLRFASKKPAVDKEIVTAYAILKKLASSE